MRKTLESARRLIEAAHLVSSWKTNRPKGMPNRIGTARNPNPTQSSVKLELESKKKKKMEPLEGRTPLATVVADCTQRWFQDTLKEAKAGDRAMQVLVAQMYYSGYGVQRNHYKGHYWFNRASRNRSSVWNSVWKVLSKHPGYKTSDSDSCEQENKDKSS